MVFVSKQNEIQERHGLILQRLSKQIFQQKKKRDFQANNLFN